MDEENVVCTYNEVLFELKKKETLPVLATWVDLEGIMLNEISQIQKDKYLVFWKFPYQLKVYELVS